MQFLHGDSTGFYTTRWFLLQEYETYAGNDGRAAFQLKEERSPDGATHGGYGFVDEDGTLHLIEYKKDRQGRM